MNRLVIAVDFDGTCVEHRYPAIGRELPGCVGTLKELIRKGHKIVLYSYRKGRLLHDALEWFAERGIPVHLPPDEPGKMLYHLFIEDRALGCPLKDGSVDWNWVRARLMRDGWIDWSWETAAAAMRDILLNILIRPENWEDYPVLFRGALLSTPLSVCSSESDCGRILSLCLKEVGAVMIHVSAAKGSRIAEGGDCVMAEGLDSDSVLWNLCMKSANSLGAIREFPAPVREICAKVRETGEAARETRDVGDGVQLILSAVPMWTTFCPSS